MRTIKTLLVAGMALFLSLAAFGNITMSDVAFGAIKTAVGMEYRHQALKVTTSEPNGVTFNPQNLRLGAAGNSLPTSFPSSNLAWFKEVQSGAVGAEDITEADIELDVPLLKDLPFAQLVSLNGACWGFCP